MRRLRFLVLVLAGAAACAPKIVPAPVVTAPKYPEFIVPAVPPSADGAAVLSEDRGWRFLQAGDLKNAAKEFETALRISPQFHPAESSLGYVELANKDPKAALTHFERALSMQESDVSALVGRGRALVALDRESDAIAAFEAALAADPSLADVRRQIDVLKFRASEQDVARARLAARTGKIDEAIAGYTRAIAASPDSAFLYRELAGVERQKGDNARALEHLRRAIALDPTDAKSLVQTGEIFESRGDLAAAEKAYTDALAIEPGDALQARIDAVRARAELARMPEARAACLIGWPAAHSRSGAPLDAGATLARSGCAHHGRQEQLGVGLDHGGGALGSHGAAAEPYVRASRDRPPRRAGRDREPSARSDCGRRAGAREVVGADACKVH